MAIPRKLMTVLENNSRVCMLFTSLVVVLYLIVILSHAAFSVEHGTPPSIVDEHQVRWKIIMLPLRFLIFFSLCLLGGC